MLEKKVNCMGYEYGDAQNIAVRCFLNQFSKRFKYFDNYYRQKTIEYFDHKCPYTGIELTYGNSERDHVIPFNKEFCGLHVYGNILIVSKEANSQKGSKSLEEYLQDDQEKLEKIKQFIKESGYDEIHDKYNNDLKIACKKLYKDIGTVIKNSCQNFEYDNLVLNSITTHGSQSNIVYNTKTKSKAVYQNKSTLSKQNIKTLCDKNDFVIQGYYTKASKNSSQNSYWANPNIKYLSKNWYLVLDDYISNILYCFFIPANSIKENQIKLRSDKPNQIDLQIQYNDTFFTDLRSKITFEKWLIKKINY